jgi:predicted nucleotidyltransferase
MYAIHTEGFDAALTLTDHIDHLPDRKRRELARIIEILFAGVEKFQATKLSEKRSAGKILKVILYGSYARGDWVEDRVSGYRSDYDLLIVVNSKAFAEEHELWEGIENELLTQQLSRRNRNTCCSDRPRPQRRERPAFPRPTFLCRRRKGWDCSSRDAWSSVSAAQATLND